MGTRISKLRKGRLGGGTGSSRSSPLEYKGRPVHFSSIYPHTLPTELKDVANQTLREPVSLKLGPLCQWDTDASSARGITRHAKWTDSFDQKLTPALEQHERNMF